MSGYPCTSVLVDRQYIDAQRDLTLQWCGSRNQRVINVQKSLKENQIVLYHHSDT